MAEDSRTGSVNDNYYSISWLELVWIFVMIIAGIALLIFLPFLVGYLTHTIYDAFMTGWGWRN